MKARERRRSAGTGQGAVRSHSFQAWLVTGPVGHLWSALADMAIVWTRWLAHRARRRG
ncbi:MAG TPA: hypothetical protein VE449_01510 [Thermoleophilaceae bacterium]|nr:hypothetical protein [Thermoleophilaceae bacterium]